MAAWIRTTWMPITDRVPESRREGLLRDLLRLYVQRFPRDAAGNLHVRMVRLEVEATKLELRTASSASLLPFAGE